MSPTNKKIWLVAIAIIISIAIGITFALQPKKVVAPEPEVKIDPELATTTVVKKPETKNTIGTSVEGRAIETYTFGNGTDNILFVGGIHGGYEWNSTLLAYQFIDEIGSGKFLLPSNLTVTIIPTLNPDGLYEVVKKEGRFTIAEIPPNDAHVTGTGRFNANGVDLNRNFACKWKPKSTWRGKEVSAGTEAFSEPEAVALRTLVNKLSPKAVVFWHSQANTVYASECEAGVLAETLVVMNTYANAAEYNSVETFDAYPVSGDAEGWLASIGIPAITVELETRTSPEWERNKQGIEALIKLYAK